MLVGIGLLLLPLVPGIGKTINGARIWVSIGPVNFQPGEFAKIALAVFFAGYLVDKRELLRVGALSGLRCPRPEAPRPGARCLGRLAGGHGRQKDLGSSLLFFALFVVMLWVATERATYLVLGAGLFAGGAAFAWRCFDHVQDRVDDLARPVAGPAPAGYQVVQASSPWPGRRTTGTGPRPRQPRPHPGRRDRLHLRRHRRGARPARRHRRHRRLPADDRRRAAHRHARTEDPFEKLLAAGLTTLIGLQAFIIIGGVIRLLSRSPASPCRSSATAGRRWSPTTCCSPCSCASATTRARPPAR